ncbi:MAG: CDP-glycerol glycerophosphotransferase family protein, partial [Candidatus Cloacimonetes bacterium]|nr:CDP-glycerol glycerophosphotransferase family protein [Candidatus Cloacimonadota bacterium]
MIKALFDLKMEYHLNSIFPLYQELAKDKNYDIRIRVGKDPEKILGLFLISKKEKIVSYLKKQGYELTNNTKGFDVVISCDALKKPEKYGDVIRITLDHGVGIKTSRIRNIVKQPDFSYHVFLEGQYWFDYIKSLGWENKADFHITGLPKLDPLFWKGFYDNKKLNSKLGFDPDKKTVLFAPSYKPSCIDFIKEKIVDLIPKYNLIIKLHPYSWSGRYAPHSHHRFYEKLAE